jgi:hypothetical protein
MPFNLTPELLQEISVRVVSKFITKQASLNESIADEAKGLELNPEQIKRVIEASNTIAYLRQLEDASDRSFEFPVADYKDVMGKLVLPEDMSVKTASSVLTTEPKKEIVCPAVVSSMGEQEKIAMLMKETFRVKQTLEKMAGEGHILSLQLETLSSKIHKDSKGLEKLAQVSTEEDLSLLSTLCGFSKEASTVGSVFKQAELADVLSLNALFKEAKDLVLEKAEKEEFMKRATEILIEKKAFSPLGVGAELLGRAAGGLARGATIGVAKAVKGVAAGVVALSAGKTLVKRVEHAADLGISVASAPSMKHTNNVWESIHN